MVPKKVRGTALGGDHFSHDSPIGIGEVVRRIIGKAVLGVISQDIQAVTGTIYSTLHQSNSSNPCHARNLPEPNI